MPRAKTPALPDDGEDVRSGRGGRLQRSEVVTVRLDPRLRYLAELAARKQRRTVSSLIEWTLEASLPEVELRSASHKLGRVSLAMAAIDLWDVDESDRFIRLAVLYPELLTHDEQVLWKLIREEGYVRPVEGDHPDSFEVVKKDFRAKYQLLKAVAAGRKPRSALAAIGS